jgi:hypothetical protein
MVISLRWCGAVGPVMAAWHTQHDTKPHIVICVEHSCSLVACGWRWRKRNHE